MTKSSSSHPAALYQLRKITRILALIILLLVFVGFFLPTAYRVERSVFIGVPSDRVYSVMLSGDRLPEWMFIQGGHVVQSEGVLKQGDSVALQYNDVVEQGVLSFTDVSADLIRFDVRPKPKVNLVHNEIALQSSNGGTVVKWVIEGDLSAGLLSPYLALFANDIAGANFERSLQLLKEQVEHVR
ncbi:hypothetical protein MACH16_13430 [Marinomonas pontica]|uniref:SRPBCC family protein n=1 Tax=Marinomonas pontica TaxID=264739 RepID=A0ABM8FE49_9GAMM|nr:hypothetical protein MACH16_13430 [Marinomonas pontica]